MRHSLKLPRQVHSDDVEIIEFSYVIYDAKERFSAGMLSWIVRTNWEAEKMVKKGQHFCKNQRTIGESMAFFMQASRIAPLDLSMRQQSSGTCVFANGEAASLARRKLQTGLVCTGWHEKGSSSP